MPDGRSMARVAVEPRGVSRIVSECFDPAGVVPGESRSAVGKLCFSHRNQRGGACGRSQHGLSDGADAVPLSRRPEPVLPRSVPASAGAATSTSQTRCAPESVPSRSARAFAGSFAYMWWHAVRFSGPGGSFAYMRWHAVRSSGLGGSFAYMWWHTIPCQHRPTLRDFHPGEVSVIDPEPAF